MKEWLYYMVLSLTIYLVAVFLVTKSLEIEKNPLSDATDVGLMQNHVQ